MANTVKVTHETLGEREMSTAQFALIGDNPDTNGGWKVATPAELSDVLNEDGGVDDNAAILQTAQLKYKELTGKTATKKQTLADLDQVIAEAEAERQKNLDNA